MENKIASDRRLDMSTFLLSLKVDIVTSGL